MNNTPLYFPPINKLGNISFRRVCKFYGADFVFTEMIRGDKILENDEHQLNKLNIPESMQNFTIVQIICEDINLIEKTVEKIVGLFPNIFEINYNMGCPQSSLCKNECGGGIVANPALVEKVAKRLFDSCSKFNIKPSIKIRLGISRDNITIYENVKRMLKVGVKKIYIHGRVLNDTYNKPATFREIEKVIKDFPELEIVANGDVRDSLSLNLILKTKPMGVLIGRAALENPMIFKELKSTNGFKLKKSGIEIKDKKEMILNFLNYAKDDNISLSHIKQNIAYLTKGVIGGAQFRKKINDILSIEKIIQLTEKN